MKITKFLKIKFVKIALGLAALIAIAIPAAAVAVPASASTASGGSCGACPGRLFITSAVEHPNGTVTLPLHQGISKGQPVYYVVTDASDGSVALVMNRWPAPELPLAVDALAGRATAPTGMARAASAAKPSAILTNVILRNLVIFMGCLFLRRGHQPGRRPTAAPLFRLPCWRPPRPGS